MEELKLTEEQIKEMQSMQCEKRALEAAQATHLDAVMRRHMALREVEENWWRGVLGAENIATGWLYDTKAGVVRRC